MKKFNGIDGMRVVCQSLHSLLSNDNDERILVGITGPVASGKTRFTRELIRYIKALGHNKSVTPLPFDLWINSCALNNSTYNKRFLMENFRQTIRCVKNKTHFLVPRYDLYKQDWSMADNARPATPQMVSWEGMTFDKVEAEKDINLPGSDGTYLASSNNLPYSYFANKHPSVFVVDGTLIAQKELRGCYDLLAFVVAPWVNRVANMVRRFNRNEVFGSTIGSVTEYVEFLIDEARSCADKEIFDQLSQDIIEIEYSPMSLSNYLDLWYLRELMMTSPKITHWVDDEEVNKAIKQFIVKLREEYDYETLNSLRDEFEHLAQAKHLLCLSNKDNILRELSIILK